MLTTLLVYVCGAILTVLLCWISDRVKKRSIFVMCLLCGELVGYIFALVGSAVGGVPGLVYAGCFIATACCYPAYVLTIVSSFPDLDITSILTGHSHGYCRTLLRHTNVQSLRLYLSELATWPACTLRIGNELKTLRNICSVTAWR